MSKLTQAALADMLSDILRDPCTMRLYVNQVGPDPTANDFVEPEGKGYAPKGLRLTGWDMTRAPQEAVYPKQTWRFAGPIGLVHGFYVTRNSDGKLRWFEPFVDESGQPAPQRVINDGDEISVTPSFEFGAVPDEGDLNS